MGEKPPMRPKKHRDFNLYHRWYTQYEKMRVASLNRQAAIEKGECDLSLSLEQALLADMGVEKHMAKMKKLLLEMAEYEFGVVWHWLSSIRGLGTGWLPIRLLALTDDIERFPLPSKYRRYCGLAVIEGEAERNNEHFSRQLKSLLLGDNMIAEQFIMQRTPVYREIYEEYRQYLEEERGLTPVCRVCGAPGYARKVAGKNAWFCKAECKGKPEGGGPKIEYTPMHLYRMSKRPVAQIFLTHVWLIWRRVEGLSITKPWILAQDGHNRYVPPPNWPMSGWEEYAV
jgi:hypothetical protein